VKPSQVSHCWVYISSGLSQLGSVQFCPTSPVMRTLNANGRSARVTPDTLAFPSFLLCFKRTNLFR
jgi:hypothetical protein